MKIGVWLDPEYDPQVGGGYSYYNRLIKGLDTFPFNPKIELCFIVEGQKTIGLSHPVVKLHYSGRVSRKELIEKHLPFFRSRAKRHIAARFELERKQCYEQELRDAGIQMVYYPRQCQCELESFPFVATTWDIGHRSSWAFPEIVNGDFPFELREDFFNRVLAKAVLVFSESEAGKEELLKYTSLNPNRIRVVRLFAGESSQVQVTEEEQKAILSSLEVQKYKYFFYPAQFWAHKNHHSLIQAFATFLPDHADCKLVLTGSDKGVMKYIQTECERLGIAKNVAFTGFVTNKVVSALYRNATAMVMPTLLGPTNMPLLEAMELGCPVICSDLPGHKEQLAEAAVYVNPLDVNEIHLALNEMADHRDEWSERVKKQALICPFTLTNALEAINKALVEVIQIRETWGCR